ncbi:MAG: hypothetical protein ACK4I8_10840, partial [Armatimonadota bacterium]
PPVYLWCEGYTEFKKTHEHFSDWLLKEIELDWQVVKGYGESMLKKVGKTIEDVFGDGEEKGEGKRCRC